MHVFKDNQLTDSRRSTEIGEKKMQIALPFNRNKDKTSTNRMQQKSRYKVKMQKKRV